MFTLASTLAACLLLAAADPTPAGAPGGADAPREVPLASGFGWQSAAGAGAASEADHLPHKSSEELYTETWEQAFQLDGGWVVHVQFLITNMGLGDSKGAVMASVIDPRGQATVLKNGRTSGDWSWSAEPGGVRVALAKHKLLITPPRFELHLENSQGVLDLRGTSRTEAYRAGTLDFGGDKRFGLVVQSLGMDVEGAWTAADAREATPMRGRGYALHYWQNFGGQELASTWVKFASLERGRELVIVDLEALKKGAAGRVGLVLLAQDGKVAHAFVEPRRRDSLWKTDGRSKKRNRVPIVMDWKVRAADGASVDGTLRLTRLAQRWDVLEGLGRVERFVLEKLSQPIQYRFVADYDFVVKVGGTERRLAGKGLGEVVMVAAE